MGGRAGEFYKEKANANYSANKAEFRQAQKTYQSKMKFGQSDSRAGGLSQDEIGAAPTMKFSQGLLGAAERTLAGSPEEEEKRKGLGFGARGGSRRILGIEGGANKFLG
jgi:hypothetical protein